MSKYHVYQKPLAEPPIEALWGDGSNDDSPAIQVLFRGGAVFDIRAGKMLAASTLRELPPGLYRLIPPLNPCPIGH